MANVMTTQLVATLSSINEPHHGMSMFTEANILDFFDAVKKAIPNVYLVRKTHREAWVCHPRDPFTLGYIGRDDALGDLKFTIYARDIDNGRFGRGTRQRNMLASNDMRVAVRNAKKFLRMHSVTELAAVQADTVGGLMRTALSDYHTKKAQLGRLFNGDALKAELRCMVEEGRAFHNPRVRDDLVAYFDAERAAAAVENHNRKMVFVHVTNDWRGQIMQVASMAGANGTGFYSFAPMTSTPTQEYVVQEVQPDTWEHAIMGRVSVLSMVPEKTYVEGVGIKTTESIYYVEV